VIICRQAVSFGTNQGVVILFSWEGNRRCGGN